MKNIKSENGQSLVIIAIAFVGLIAIAALIIDGGSLYLSRRNAQTAADAAAMAGAHEMCVNNGTTTSVEDVIEQYALTENDATQVESVIDPTNYSITVRTTIETDSFFANIIGQETNTARAEASAGCFPPSVMTQLLPVAWTCRPRIGGSTSSCTIHSIPWNVFTQLYTTVSPPNPWFNFGPGTSSTMLLTEGDGVDYHTYTDNDGGVMTYILMDSDTFNQNTDCMEAGLGGSIHCDLNDDGVLDVEGGANRGWLYLGDQGGAAALSDIIQNGYPEPIEIPQWFPGTNGVAASVFDSAAAVKYKPLYVPVFNAICDGTTADDIQTDCPGEFVDGDLVNGENPGSTFYRVPGFSAFVVTCVSKGNPAAQRCPGKAMTGIASNVKTIEGYFVNGFSAGTNIDPNGFHLGVYIISLTK